MKPLSPSALFDLSSYQHSALFENCTYVWEALAKLKEYIAQSNLGQLQGDISDRAYLVNAGQISIGKGSVVEPGAYIEGPCWIGENCTVRHGAYIRGNVITGNRCILGHDSEFKHSILLNGSQAAHFAYVGDSILGNHINLGAGTVCANLKLDRTSVAIKIDGDRIDTGLRKLGAILGDNAQTGCNAVLNPGTIFGKGALCYPCVNVSGYLSPGTKTKMAK